MTRVRWLDVAAVIAMMAAAPVAARHGPRPGVETGLPFDRSTGFLDGYSLRVPRRGACRWNGQDVDPAILDRYLAQFAALPRAAGRLFVAIEPGTSPACAAAIRRQVIDSGLCAQRRCAEVGWRVKRPVVNRDQPGSSGNSSVSGT